MNGITELQKIKNCVAKTSLELKDAPYLENHYQNVLIHKLINCNFVVSREVVVAYKLPNNFVFGHGRIDVLLETEKVIYILELKIQAKLATAVGQLKRYMIHIPNPNRKIIKGAVVSFNHYNQFTIKILTLKPLSITFD